MSLNSLSTLWQQLSAAESHSCARAIVIFLETAVRSWSSLPRFKSRLANSKYRLFFYLSNTSRIRSAIRIVFLMSSIQEPFQ
jgi:hypothetical protein